MFNFFKKKKINRLADKVWMNEKAWQIGMKKFVESLQENYIVILCSYFKESVDKSIVIFDSFSDSSKAVYAQRQDIPRMISFLKKLYITESDFLTSNLIKQLEEKALPKKLCIVFTEHYPTFQKEKDLLDSLEIQLQGKFDVVFCTHLQHPLMQIFGSERIQKLMEMLGVGEEECIEHSMISTSIERAQKKVGEKVITEALASSAESWFRLNHIKG